MEAKKYAANLSKLKLDYIQIEQILKQGEEYIKANETATTPIIEYCPKCGEKGTKLIKACHTENGKKMFRCMDCNKRFVSDTGQLTFYSHQNLSKWRILQKDYFVV